MKIVGFCGSMGHGKDTAAKALLSYGYNRIAFADPLKEAILRLNPVVIARHSPAGITSDQSYPVSWLNRLDKLVAAYGWEGAKQSEDVRRLLQVFGTEVCRSLFGFDCWIRVAQARIDDALEFSRAMGTPDPNFAVTDVRFLNEAHWIKDNGGLLIHVRRNEEAQVTHQSEALEAAKLADFTIENNGSVEDLHRAVLEVCGIFIPQETEYGLV